MQYRIQARHPAHPSPIVAFVDKEIVGVKVQWYIDYFPGFIVEAQPVVEKTRNPRKVADIIKGK